MKLARGIERRLENLVDGVSASVFRGTMHPVSIANRLLRQIEFLAEETPVGTQVPNDIAVLLHPADIDPEIDLDALETELAAMVTATATENGWRLIGPVDVHVEPSQEVPRGIIQCAGESVRGRMAAWGQLISANGSVVVHLTLNRSLIGRALDCDIRFANTEVSRHHAILTREGSQVRLRDLGSSNGTRINGVLLGAAPAAVLPGATVALGDLVFSYRPVT